MIILRQGVFSKREKDESYGDIDEQAPKDPYYHKWFKKWGKRGAIAGAGTAAAGAGLIALGGKTGSKSIERLNEISEQLSNNEFFNKDHFNHEGSGDWFDKQLQETRARNKRSTEKLEKEIKDIYKKSGKKIRLTKAGRAAVGLGSTAAMIGGAAYLGAKLGDNARKTSKKDRKDIIVQADREIRRDIRKERSYSEKEKKSNALAASSAVAGVGTGTAFLGKHLLDKAEKKTNAKNLEGIQAKFKAGQRDLVRRRRAAIDDVDGFIKGDIKSIEYAGKSEKKMWDMMAAEDHPNPIKSRQSSGTIHRNESVTRNGKTYNAGYDAKIEYIGENPKLGKAKWTAVGEQEAKDAVQGSKKDFINVRKQRALNENDLLKHQRKVDIASEGERFAKKLKKNKKLRTAALVGTGLAAAGTYGYMKHKEKKKNNK